MEGRISLGGDSALRRIFELFQIFFAVAFCILPHLGFCNLCASDIGAQFFLESGFGHLFAIDIVFTADEVIGSRLTFFMYKL